MIYIMGWRERRQRPITIRHPLSRYSVLSRQSRVIDYEAFEWRPPRLVNFRASFFEQLAQVMAAESGLDGWFLRSTAPRPAALAQQ
jgi:hypothetical protein